MINMEVLMTGNQNIILMMYLMQSGIEININQPCAQVKEFSQRLSREVMNSDVEFKPSVFNYHVETPKKYLVYNTLYNALAKLSKQEYAKLQGQQRCGRDLRKKFLEMGFAVTNEIDERENYRKWRNKIQQDLQYLSINITTTLKCNARCPYCYEKGVKPVDFDESLMDSLIKFIKNKKKSQPVKLNWFGGEPLMNPKIIDEVTTRLGEQGFEYDSFIITNGSLITKKLIKSKFKNWNMRGLQITLDGTAENYEKSKGYVGRAKNMFSKILDHIEWIAQAGIHVDIRLNTDRNNLNDMFNLIYILQERFDGNDKVVYYPAFVTGLEDKLTEEEKVEFVKKLFVELANPNKMSITDRLYSFPRNIPCMRNDPQSFSVDVYGKIYSCEHLVGHKEEAMGTLKRLSNEVNQARLDEPLREECETCVFLPKCMGGCASNLRTGDPACMINKYMIQAYMEYMCE